MDNDLKQKKSTTEAEVPLGQLCELVFDDQPLDALLAGTEPIAPTPVGVVERWGEGIDRSEPCLNALIARLAMATCMDHETLAGRLDGIEEYLRDKIELTSGKSDHECARYCLALARVLRVEQRVDESEPYYRKALAIQERLLGRDDEATRNTLQELIAILSLCDRNEESRRLFNLEHARRVACKHDQSSLFRRRVLALDMVLVGQYAEAEEIYLYLVDKHFELPSTYCHLIRLYLMTDRENEARVKIDQAGKLLSEAPSYIRVRINFFRVLFLMNTGQEWQSHLGELKQSMNNENAYMHWSMQPVLDHLKPRLREEEYKMLSTIVSVLAEPSQKGVLELNRLWKYN